MEGIGRGVTIGKDNPRLIWFVADEDGYLVDPSSVSFQIWDDASGTPTKRIPAPAGQGQPTPPDFATLDLVTSKLGTGRYALPWTISGSEPVGYNRAVVKWTLDGVERTRTQVFEVLPAGMDLVNSYCLLADLRAEGLSETEADNARVLRKIKEACSFIDQACERTFAPVFKTLVLDGGGVDTLFLDEPIIFVEDIVDVGIGDPNLGSVIYTKLVYIRNRHITRGQLTPDDRDDPRIVLADDVFTDLPDSVELTGVFGYTNLDPLAEPPGVTPQEIREVAMKIAFRNMPKLFQDGGEERYERRNAHRVVSESTSGQSYSLSPASGGEFMWTGDPELDTVLARYRRPIAIGVV